MSQDTIVKSADTTGLFHREVIRAYDRTVDWVLTAGPRIVLAVVILIAGLWIIRVLRQKLNKRMHRRKVHSSLRPFFESLVFTALHIALFLLIMQVIGIRLTIFAAVIAAFGAAVGLALSGTLQNFASGVLILLLKPFNVGDNVVAQGLEGTVRSIQIFYTVITTFDNKTVIMPNSKLSNEVIINITQQGYRRIDIPIKFRYEIDFDKVKDVLMKLFVDLPEVCDDPLPRIGVTVVDKEDYTVMSNIWVNAHGFEDLRLKVNAAIVNALTAEGIVK